MASIFQAFDLNEALSGGKHPRRHVDGGFEAPRNSLDVPDEAFTNVSRSPSSLKPEDIPFGYEYYNPGLAGSGGRWKRDGSSRTVGHDKPELEIRRRAPNVVARLMGLDALPDELPTVRPRKSLQEMPTYGCAKAAGGSPLLIRQHSQGAVPSSWQRPPRPRNAQRATANYVSDEEERVLAPMLPFRDHPQEEQLQKFKEEFEAKQQERSRNSQLEDMNRELEEKKNKVRATLDKARIALSQGIVAEPKHRLNGQGKFEESKEFLDAMEFLQCNKDFIFQFLQQKPHVVFSNENSNVTTPVLTHPKTPRKGKGGSATGTPRDSTERKREGFSPRAIARLFMPSDTRKRNDKQQQQQPVTPPSATGSHPNTIERCSSAGSRRGSTDSQDIISDDVKLRTSSSTNSRYMLPPASPKVSRDEVRSSNKNSARDVIVEIKERLRQRDEHRGTGLEEVRVAKDISKEHLRGSLPDSKAIAREISKNAREGLGSRKTNNFTLTKSLSTGKRISLQRPDMEEYMSEGEELSMPLVKIARENVSRACVSLPSSPHLSARSNEVATSPKVPVTRKRVAERTKTLATDSAATLRAAERATAKKTSLTSEFPRRESPRSSIEADKSMRRSASVNETASRSSPLKQKADSPAGTSKRYLDGANEPASNLTRCRSVPNVALLRERGQCTKEAVRKSTAETIPEVVKLARSRNSEKRKLGLFSIGKSKKGRDGTLVMPPSPAPVLARVAALAEACVSQSHTLSDTDSAANVRIHVRTSRNGSTKGKERPRAMVLPPRPATYAEFLKKIHESSPADESVIPESSADSDAGPCEDEFLEVLSQLTPLAPKRKSTDESPIAAKRLPSTPQTHKVQNGKKSPKLPQRARTTARDIVENVDEAGQDSSSEKNGQPSPVSVLEPPFEEESPSPLEFKEITNDLQELRSRLQSLKADGGERVRGDLENIPEVAEARIPRETKIGALLNSDRELSRTSTNLQHKIRADLCVKAPIPCSAGPEADFAFVRDILVSSGFHIHGGRNLSRWHSLTQPISHHILAKVEAASYSDKQGGSNRQILFDAINEILVGKLEPQCYEQPWLRMTPSRNVAASSKASGRRLVEDVWNEIYQRQFPARCQELHNDYLESLVAQDLKMSTAWLSLHHDVDRICLKLETAIYDDLIQELCGGLLQVL